MIRQKQIFFGFSCVSKELATECFFESLISGKLISESFWKSYNWHFATLEVVNVITLKASFQNNSGNSKLESLLFLAPP